MIRNKSIYLISAFEIEKSKYSESYFKSQSYSAYFGNLKQIYELLSGEKLKSYSTLSRSIAKSGNYGSKDLYLKIDNQKIKCCRIIIRKIDLNTFYKMGKTNEYFDIEKILIREMGIRKLLTGLEFS